MAVSARRYGRPHGKPDRRRDGPTVMRIAAPCCCRRRPASTSWAAGCCLGAGSVYFSSSSTAHAIVRCPCSSSGRPADEGQDDPAGADRGDQPLLAAHQILAVPAAWPCHAGRVSGRRRRRRDSGRARRGARSERRARPCRHSGLHHVRASRLSHRRPLPESRGVCRAWRIARHVAARRSRRRMRTRSFWARRRHVAAISA